MICRSFFFLYWMESLYFNNIIVVLCYELNSDSLNRISLSIVSVVAVQIFFFTNFPWVSIISCLDMILFRGCEMQDFLNISL